MSDEPVREPGRKIGLKKTNNRPISPQVQKNIAAKDFEQTADQHFAKIEDYKSQMWELAVKYRSFITNRVLPVNRGPIASNIEKEVLDELIKLASTMNEDVNQPESVGSTSLCMILMKCMLLQRDRCNELSYELDELKNKIAKTNAP